MVKFVILDDCEEDILRIKKLIDEEVREDKEIVSFTKVNAGLKKEIKDVSQHKIYVLDIQLDKNISGINVAKLIREVDYDSEIIFITNHDKMFECAHRSVYEIFSFIEKFHDFDKKFKKDIREILKRNFDNKMFKYKPNNNVELNIYYKYILYIYREKEDRKLVIVADKNRFVVNMCLKEIMMMLDARFEFSHRSCIVNKYRIVEKNYKEGYFRLDNGDKVYMLSKKHKKELEV